MGNHHSTEVTEQKILNEKLKIWKILNSSNAYNEAIHKPWIKMTPVPTSNISKPFQINDYEFIIFELQCIYNVYKYNSITKQWNQIILNNTDQMLENCSPLNIIYTFNPVTNTLYVADNQYQYLDLYEINLNNAQCIKHKISFDCRNFWRVIICTNNELHLMSETQHFMWNITQSKIVNFQHIDNLLVHYCELHYMQNMQCIHLKQEHKLILFTFHTCDVGIEIFEYSLCTNKWKKLDVTIPYMDHEFMFNILPCHNDQFILIIKKMDPEFIWIMDVKNNEIKPLIYIVRIRNVTKGIILMIHRYI